LAGPASVAHDAMGKKTPESTKARPTSQETEGRFRAAIAASLDAVLLTAPDGRVFMANPAACRMFGRTESELIQFGRDGVVDATDPRLAAALDERDRTGSFRGELTFLRSDGTKFPGEISSAVFRDENGAPCTSMVVRDVSERHLAAAALARSESRYRSLFEHMVEGFAYCRMLFEDNRPQDFIYLAVNEAFGNLTGLRDVIGKNVSEVIPGIRETDPELFKVYGRVAQSGRPERFETFVKALDMWFAISVYSPEKEHFVAVFDVITARKRAEARIRDQLDELRRWHAATLGREDRIRELKREVNVLCGRVGEAPRYASADPPTSAPSDSG